MKKHKNKAIILAILVTLVVVGLVLVWSKNPTTISINYSELQSKQGTQIYSETPFLPLRQIAQIDKGVYVADYLNKKIWYVDAQTLSFRNVVDLSKVVGQFSVNEMLIHNDELYVVLSENVSDQTKYKSKIIAFSNFSLEAGSLGEQKTIYDGTNNKVQFGFIGFWPPGIDRSKYYYDFDKNKPGFDENNLMLVDKWEISVPYFSDNLATINQYSLNNDYEHFSSYIRTPNVNLTNGIIYTDTINDTTYKIDILADKATSYSVPYTQSIDNELYTAYKPAALFDSKLILMYLARDPAQSHVLVCAVTETGTCSATPVLKADLLGFMNINNNLYYTETNKDGAVSLKKL